MKFGTSGLRGLVSDMTDAACAAYTRAFIDYLRRRGPAPETVLIGRDLRPSSPRIAAACREAVAAAGLTAQDCGACPTPALALEALRLGAPAIMVTGSHIPFDRNGLKFYRGDGEIDKADEAGVLEALAAPAPGRPGGALATLEGVGARYLERLEAFYPGRPLTGRRIGVYQHSAVGRDMTVAALERLGATCAPLGRADAFVPIDTEAVRPEDAERAARWSREYRLDAIVSTDGDGDRPLIADEAGRFLRGDLVGVLTARRLGADAVATPVSSNTALERSGWFARVARTRIGSPYVIEAMARLAAEGAALPVAYEANGGFLLGGAARNAEGATLAPLPTRDALLPIATLLCMAAERGVDLSALVGDLPARATASDRLERVDMARVATLLETLRDDSARRNAFLAPLDGGAAREVDLTDGLRMTLDTGEIAHLRPSGNAPELRGYAEAETPARAETLAAALLSAAAKALA